MLAEGVDPRSESGTKKGVTGKPVLVFSEQARPVKPEGLDPVEPSFRFVPLTPLVVAEETEARPCENRPGLIPDSESVAVNVDRLHLHSYTTGACLPRSTILKPKPSMSKSDVPLYVIFR